MASLSPVTAGQPVGNARSVRAVLLLVHQTSHRRVFRDVAYSATPITPSVYGLRLRSSVFGRRTCVYSKIFSDIPLVGPNAISKNSNNVVISSPRVFIFSDNLVPNDSFPYIWSLDLERFWFGRQGAPKFFFQTRFSRQPLVISPKFFQGRVPHEGPYLSSGDMGVGGQIWGPGPQIKIF